MIYVMQKVSYFCDICHKDLNDPSEQKVVNGSFQKRIDSYSSEVIQVYSIDVHMNKTTKDFCKNCFKTYIIKLLS